MAKALVVPFMIPCRWPLIKPHVTSVQATVVVECLQLATLAVLTRFVAGIVHEINSPPGVLCSGG